MFGARRTSDVGFKSFDDDNANIEAISSITCRDPSLAGIIDGL
jgi:hypothetical protein